MLSMFSASYLDTQSSPDKLDLRSKIVHNHRRRQKRDSKKRKLLQRTEQKITPCIEKRGSKRIEEIKKNTNKNQSSRFEQNLPPRQLETRGESQGQIRSGRLPAPAASEPDGSLTNTGGGLCSEAGLALAHKAAGRVDAHISHLATALVLEAALIYVCRWEGGLSVGALFFFFFYLRSLSRRSGFTLCSHLHVCHLKMLNVGSSRSASPTQPCPSRAITYPAGHEQVKEPGLFLHSALA